MKVQKVRRNEGKKRRKAESGVIESTHQALRNKGQSPGRPTVAEARATANTASGRHAPTTATPRRLTRWERRRGRKNKQKQKTKTRQGNQPTFPVAQAHPALHACIRAHTRRCRSDNNARWKRRPPLHRYCYYHYEGRGFPSAYAVQTQTIREVEKENKPEKDFREKSFACFFFVSFTINTVFTGGENKRHTRFKFSRMAWPE